MSLTSRLTPTTSSRSPQTATGASVPPIPPSRPEWWRPQGANWPSTWLPIAVEARNRSATAFLDITKASLTGALNSVTSSYRTKQYQELVVIALTACHVADSAAPLGLLDHLAAFTGSGVAQGPQFVLKAFERELTARSVERAYERARVILPDASNASG
ncbi:MAG TPA: hypothetical protein VMA73_26490 [Streptosporangiaceae bacterium]|nr:hypothetical protein [Streptosporangiaceae bacterium]